jgi:EAL domain-containing protein (putative c-di-GMP-specific phosphodiesterase class I)
MDEAAKRKRQLEQELRVAVATGQLEVHYQPIVDSSTGRVAACEALVRWRHPERGMIAPDEFIRAAEETGIILDLGRFVLRQACSDALSWPAHVRLAVNVSPKQFSLGQDLVDDYTSILRDFAFPHDRLELEITEGTLVEYKEPLAELSARGIRISLDDFGTGYSSLSYLQQFQVDKIKIDRSFTRNLNNKASLAVVEAISSLARALQVELVVEGVETPGQLLLLTTRNVRLIQGYLFSRPVVLSDLRPMLERPFDVAVTASAMKHVA